eukprot:TRINITY_DN35264_c0_g1_i1.p1 TRINITY_DN35264_c0_g1~~TRINITY_DN35264_c0_g1_i1.p1  ORF type:complete len:357 (+),score=75.01 TRINITY_DN35264_c0_g1_i1:56-1072(+)
MRKYGLIGCGSNVVDLFYKVKVVPKVGQKGYFLPGREGIEDARLVGGVTLNHLSWAASYGVDTALLALQGEDEIGKQIRSKMMEHNIGTEFLKTSSSYTSSVSHVLSQEDGERSILMAPASTSTITKDIASLHWDTSVLSQTSIFSTEISQVPLSGVIQLLKTAKAAGATTALDVDVSVSVALKEANLGTFDEFLTCLEMADIIKPTLHAAVEVLEMMPKGEGSSAPLSGVEVAQKLQNEFSSKMIVITDGGEGSYAKLANSDSAVSVRPPKQLGAVTDSTGAGDAFFGGLLAAILKFGNPWEDRSVCHQILTTANEAGYNCCLTQGGLPLKANVFPV